MCCLPVCVFFSLFLIIHQSVGLSQVCLSFSRRLYYAFIFAVNVCWQVVSGGRVQECDPPHLLLQDTTSFFYKMCEELGKEELKRLKCVAQEKFENKPYVSPPINPLDLGDPAQMSASSASPINLNVLPSFHSSRLVGVLNQLPTNKFSTERL